MPFVLALLFLASACNDRSASASVAPPRTAATAAAAPSAKVDLGPIRIEALPGAKPPMFVLQGGPRGDGRIVFLHGMCGHGQGYAQSFQFQGAAIGTIIAPQADVSCGGEWSKWSGNVDKLDARITETFRTLGHPEPIDDILVIGMSQGATRAADLARKWPTRYTRLISMDAPTAIRPGDLKGLRGAVMMAGERDRQDLMRASQRALERTGVPVTFVLIPGATHGAMGPTPEKTMGTAFAFLQALSTAPKNTP